MAQLRYLNHSWNSTINNLAAELQVDKWMQPSLLGLAMGKQEKLLEKGVTGILNKWGCIVGLVVQEWEIKYNEQAQGLIWT